MGNMKSSRRPNKVHDAKGSIVDVTHDDAPVSAARPDSAALSLDGSDTENESQGDVIPSPNDTDAKAPCSASSSASHLLCTAPSPLSNPALQRLYALPLDKLFAYMTEEFAEVDGATMDPNSYNFTTSVQYMNLNRYMNVLAHQDTLFPSARYAVADLPGTRSSRAATTTTGVLLSNSADSALSGESSGATMNTPRYINANWIDLDVSPCFVACQAPVPEGMAAFLRTLCEHDITLVLMLTKLSEGGMPKANRYWPADDEQEMWVREAGAPPVRVSRDLDDPYLYDAKQQIWRRPLRIDCGDLTPSSTTQGRKGGTHKIIQYQYTGWPDQGVPLSTAPFNTLLQIIRDYVQQQEELQHQEEGEQQQEEGQEQQSSTLIEGDAQTVQRSVAACAVRPVVVHCSAGIGRTGTLIGAYAAVRLLEQGNFTPRSMAYLLRRMRAARFGMVQRVEQYMYMYQIVLRYAGYRVGHIARALRERSSQVQARLAMPRQRTPPTAMYRSSVSAPVMGGPAKGMNRP